MEGLHLFDQLVYVDPVLLDSLAMCLHYLLRHVLLMPYRTRALLSHVPVGPRHLLHLVVGRNRLLTIDLRNEVDDRLLQRSGNLPRHVRNDCDYFLLPLECFVVNLDHIEVVVAYFGCRELAENFCFAILLLPLTVGHGLLDLFLNTDSVLKLDISGKGVDRELFLVHHLVLVDLLIDPVA